MSALITYIRKNAMFVGLLSVLLIACIGFGGYMLIQKSENEKVILPPEGEETAEKTASISSFEGSYGRDATVYLNWTIDRNNQELQSVKLFHDGKQIGGEMKDLSAFAMAQSVYQFPSGNCTFSLRAEFADDVVVSKDINVFISYVMDIDMVSEEVDDGLLLKLKYAYDKQNPVSVPRIKFTNGGSTPFAVSYQDTKQTVSGTIIHAETIFKLNTDNLAPGSYPVTIRWIFEGLNISKDYNITVNKK